MDSKEKSFKVSSDKTVPICKEMPRTGAKAGPTDKDRMSVGRNMAKVNNQKRS